ncbi:hypothetical protein PAMP_011296 [Pampus punctatissimus]
MTGDELLTRSAQSEHLASRYPDSLFHSADSVQWEPQAAGRGRLSARVALHFNRQASEQSPAESPEDAACMAGRNKCVA